MAVELSRLNPSWRKFFVSLWAGWKITSNWTEPFIFFIYLLFKPLSSVLILVVMFYVITGNFSGEQLLFLYVGNSFFSIVRSGISAAWVIAEDRDWFETIKSIYASPGSYLSHILGRTSADFLFSTFSAVVLLLAGTLILRLPLGLDLSLMLYLLPLILIVTSALALFFSAIALFAGHGGEFIVEGSSAFIYLFSGIIFPASTLPPILKEVALTNPLTHLTNLFRAALRVGPLPNIHIIWLYAISLVFLFLGVFFFNWSFRLALKLGILDQKASH